MSSVMPTDYKYPYYDACLDIDSYSLKKDFDDIFLGHGNTLEVQPTATVKAIFSNDGEVAAFYNWWEIETKRGVDPFILKLNYFGIVKNMGVFQTSELAMVKKPAAYEISFGIRIVFDEDDIENEIPIALDKTVYIPTNTKDNYVLMEAYDIEGDPFEYEIQVPTAYGVLKGTPPAMLYTPDEDFTGVDCFSFTARDYFNKSLPAVMQIEVSDEGHPDHVIEYRTSDFLSVNGNFHYKFPDGNWTRGFGGILSPYGSEDNLVLNPSFNEDTDWALGDGATIEDGTLLLDYSDSLSATSVGGPSAMSTPVAITDFDASDTLSDIVIMTFTEQKAVRATQTVPITAGMEYRVSFRIGGMDIYPTDAGVFVRLGGESSPEFKQAGVCNSNIIAGSSDSLLAIEVTEGLRVSIDYIYVYERVNDNFVKIASFDHKIDPGTNYVEACNVIDWGNRTDYEDYLLGQNNMVPNGFAVEATDRCIGIDFTRMFRECSVEEIPTIYLDKAKITHEMFYESSIKRATFAGFAPYWTDASYMFYGSDVNEVHDMDTSTVNNFDSMFASSAVKCIEAIDSRNKNITSNMFTDTNINRPNLSEQATIVAGGLYDNDGGCGVKITGITKTGGTQTCAIATYTSSCTSTGNYTVNYSNENGAVSYQWVIGSNGSITSGGTSQTCTVDFTSAGSGTIYLSCKVTDLDGTTSSGTYSFVHGRTKGYAEIWLSKSYSQINLQSVINAATSNTEVVVYNNVVNCSIYTGNLSGKNVTFITSKEIHGFRKGRTNTNYSTNSGFVAVSDLVFINNSVVRGSGGFGGYGGKGKNDSYTVYNHEYKYVFGCGSGYSWGDHCGTNTVTLCWNNKWCNRSTTGTGPLSHDDYSGSFYRSTYKGNATCDVNGDFYQIRRTTTSSASRTGGSGGSGGYGAGYGYDPEWDHGDRDPIWGPSGSSPSGGNSGGIGGIGGWWGNDGYDGKQGAGGGAAGGGGYAAAPAITGSSHFKAGSKTGSVSGAVL